MRCLPLLATLAACQREAPVVQPVLVDGMVSVPAGVVMLGTRRQGEPPNGGMPVPVEPDEAPLEEHGEGGAARGLGGPPPVVSRPHRAVPAEQPPWESFGGDQLPPRRAKVDAFLIDATEVTRQQYRAFLEATGYKPPFVDEAWAGDDSQGGPYNWQGTRPPDGTDAHPVVLVSWYDASEYCAWAGKRLPTEAEWQLAALGPVGPDGRTRRYPWGDQYGGDRLNHGKMAAPNFDDTDGWLTTAPVGSFPSGRGPSGLDDAFGNAWEFTADHRFDSWSRYTGDVDGGVISEPRAPGPGLEVAVRGGSFFFDLSTMPEGEKHAFLPEIRRKTAGFRCAR